MRLSLVLLSIVALPAPRPAAAWQEPVEDVQLASAGPRFLARDENVRKGAEPRWRDVSNANVFRRRISLELGAVPLGHALETIARKSGLRLTYSAAVLDLKAPVTIAAADLTVGAALSAVLYEAGVDVLLTSAGQAALIRRVNLEAAVGSIAGRVTDKNGGSPIMGATVVVEGTRQSATTGQDGRYRISDVQVGTYTVRVRYIGYAPGAAAVTVNADEEATADFALEKSAQVLNEVVTTGTVVPTEVKALPTPVTVIDDSLIAQLRPHTVAEVLRQAVPTAVSWDMAGYPAASAFSVRGASTLTPGGSQMKVFVDGIEAASVDGAAVDPASIARIEVIRGPQAAAVYGSDAIGGVIQVFTKRGDPALARPLVEAEAAAGVIQTPYAGYGGVLRQDYRASVRGGGPDVSYNFGAGYTHTNDYAMPVSAQSTPSVYGGVHVTQGIVTADVTGRYYINNAPTTFNPELLQSGFPSFATPNYQTRQYQNQTIGARLSVAAAPWWKHTVTVGFDHYGQDLAQSRPRLSTPADTLMTISKSSADKASIGYTTAIQRTLGADLSGSFIAGIDHYSRPSSTVSTSAAGTTTGTIKTAPGASFFVNRAVTTNTGYFAQAQLGFRDALFVTAGLRAEENSDFGDSLGTPLAPRVGLSYVHRVGGATLKLRGSWGRAIKAPSSGLKAEVVSSSILQLANPVLGPERQQGWDSGLDLNLGARGSLSVTYYNQTAENLIQQVPLPNDSVRTFQYQNVGRVRNTGVEVEGTAAIGPLALRAQYGYARARVTRLTPGYTGDLQVGDQSRSTPQHTAGASLAFTPRTGSTLTGGVTYVGSWTAFDYLGYYRCLGGMGACRNEAPHPFDRSWLLAYPGFVKLYATLAQQLTRQVSGFVSVDNLTNNEAYEFYNATSVMGRITTVGLRVRY